MPCVMRAMRIDNLRNTSRHHKVSRNPNRTRHIAYFTIHAVESSSGVGNLCVTPPAEITRKPKKRIRFSDLRRFASCLGILPLRALCPSVDVLHVVSLLEIHGYSRVFVVLASAARTCNPGCGALRLLSLVATLSSPAHSFGGSACEHQYASDGEAQQKE